MAHSLLLCCKRWCCFFFLLLRSDPKLFRDDVDIKFSRTLNSCKVPQVHVHLVLCFICLTSIDSKSKQQGPKQTTANLHCGNTCSRVDVILHLVPSLLSSKRMVHFRSYKMWKPTDRKCDTQSYILQYVTCITKMLIVIIMGVHATNRWCHGDVVKVNLTWWPKLFTCSVWFNTFSISFWRQDFVNWVG